MTLQLIKHSTLQTFYLKESKQVYGSTKTTSVKRQVNNSDMFFLFFFLKKKSPCMMSSAIFSFLLGSPLPQKASRQRRNTKMRRLSPESHLSENEVVRFDLLLLLIPNCLLCLLVLDCRLVRLVRESIGTTETQERRRKWTSAGRVKTVRAPESGETMRG